MKIRLKKTSTFYHPLWTYSEVSFFKSFLQVTSSVTTQELSLFVVLWPPGWTEASRCTVANTHVFLLNRVGRFGGTGCCLSAGTGRMSQPYGGTEAAGLHPTCVERKSVSSRFCLLFSSEPLTQCGNPGVCVGPGVDMNASASCVYRMELLTANVFGCRRVRGDIEMMSRSPLPVSF